MQHTALTLQVADPDKVLCDRYIVLDRLGGGGYGTVYRAKDTQLDEFIALKVLPAELITDNTAVERMREEVRIAKKLRHDNIAAVYDFQIDRAKNRCFITMELVDGKNLFTLLREKGKFDLQEVLPIVEQVASALDYAHRKGVIHRDIKPQNIMLTKDGTVKVTDFGIAKRLRDEMSRVPQTQPLGTPAYMAPEHLLGEKIGREADIYSLAATVYELLSGHTPYQGSQEQIIAQVVKGKKVEPIKGVPDYVNAALLKELSHNPADRPHSAAQLYNMLLPPAAAAKMKVVGSRRLSSSQRSRKSTAQKKPSTKKQSGTPSPVKKGKEQDKVLTLLARLKNNDWHVRCDAAVALGEIGDERAVEPLIEALKDKIASVRRAAAQALGEIGDKHAVRPLIQMLKDRSVLARRASVEALGKIGDKRVVEPLIKVLRDENHSVCKAAAEALRRITGKDFGTDYGRWRRWWRRQVAQEKEALGGTGKAQKEDRVSSLIKQLNDRDWRVRCRAVEMLGKIGDRRAVESLIMVLRLGQGEYIREVAAQVLGRIGDRRAVEPLIKALKDRSRHIRRRAAQALGKIGDKSAVAPLIEALADGDSEVRKSAAEALSRITGEDFDTVYERSLLWRCSQVEEKGTPYPIHIHEAQKENRVSFLMKQLGNPEVRSSAYRELIKIGEPAVEPLIRALGDRKWVVRAYAAEALGKIGDERAVEPLIAALRDNDATVRSIAAKALERITGQNFGSNYVKWRRWWRRQGARKIKIPHHSCQSQKEDRVSKELRSKSWLVRWRAVKALGKLGDECAVELLMEALKDRNEYVRSYAVEALRKITGEDFGTDYGRWRRWWRRQKSQIH